MSSEPNASEELPPQPSAVEPVTDAETAAPSSDPGAGDRGLAGPEFFFRTDLPAWRYVIRMTVVSFVPTIMLSLLLAATGILTEDNSPSFQGPAVVLFVGIVIVSPLVETLFMAGAIWLFGLFIRHPVQLALASCVLWALLHSSAAPAWGLVVAWPFFVFSCAYLAWRRVSWIKGILVASSIHALHNLLPAMAILFAAE